MFNLRAVLMALSMALASVSLWTSDRIEGFGGNASETGRTHTFQCRICGG